MESEKLQRQLDELKEEEEEIFVKEEEKLEVSEESGEDLAKESSEENEKEEKGEEKEESEEKDDEEEGEGDEEDSEEEGEEEEKVEEDEEETPKEETPKEELPKEETPEEEEKKKTKMEFDGAKYILEKYRLEGVAFIILLILFEVFFVIFSFAFLRNGADEFIKDLEYTTVNVTDAQGHVVPTLVPTSTDDNVDTYYHMYIEVCIMIFLGFGLLMSFLKKFGWYAAGIAFLIAAVSCQLAIVCVGISHWAYDAIDAEDVEHWYIEVDLPMMILTMFAGGATLISMGALIGKLTPFQFMLMIMIEMPIYALNCVIVESWVEVQDVGGSFLVHTFGAYFGLAVSLVASKRVLSKDSKAEEKNSTNRVSNYASIVGTIVLWMLWPSFNGAMAGDLRHRVVINTYTSLVGCCIAAFIFSRLFRGKFGMEDLQNATLAGGVAIGACANMEMPIGVPLCIGIFAAFVSCVGYRWLSGLLQKIHLHDTCGVHNLHGMPGLIGALASCITTIWYNDDLPHEDWTPLVQLAGIFITLTFAIGSGLLTGLLIFIMMPFYPQKDTDYYEDVAYFEAESDVADEA